MKKNFIYKEKFYLAIKKNLELSQKQNYENLRNTISCILEPSYCYCRDMNKIRNSFKTMASKDSINMAVKKNIWLTMNVYEK